ncbi:uncharacterized protein V1516DRAFT_332944 [Lipomyces oligophaga]|uniref:uncharacterized protein n=1 Tax=Lipomyces oligophaga TaxID=45792 RepID=UPI0034CF0AA9
MAKSLRAKSRVRARAIRREKVFEPVELARVKRLASKLSSSATPSSLQAAASSESMEIDSLSTSTTAIPVAVSTSVGLTAIPAEAKISTSGWKGSRNEQWKQKKASKSSARRKKGSRSLVFGSRKKSSK